MDKWLTEKFLFYPTNLRICRVADLRWALSVKQVFPGGSISSIHHGNHGHAQVDLERVNVEKPKTAYYSYDASTGRKRWNSELTYDDVMTETFYLLPLITGTGCWAQVLSLACQSIKINNNKHTSAERKCWYSELTYDDVMT